MAVLAKAVSGSYNVFVVGGYMGSGISTGETEKTGVKLYTWLDKTLKRVFNVAPSSILRCENAESVNLMHDTVNYMPEGGVWYIDVDVNKVGLPMAKKLMKEATALTTTETENKVWLFRVPFSKTQKGFPTYQELVKVGGLGVWCTYLRRDDIEWLLWRAWNNHIGKLEKDQKFIDVDIEKTLRRNAGGELVRWFSKSYNRDIDSVFVLAHHLEAEGFGGLGVTEKSSAAAKRNVVSLVGNASSSLEEWVLSVVGDSSERSFKSCIEMAQRLYSSSGDRLYPVVMTTINGLFEVKMQLINGDAYKGIYKGNWLNEDSERYTKYERLLQPSVSRWGKKKQGIPLENLINARNILMGARRWYRLLDVFLWVYQVRIANEERVK